MREVSFPSGHLHRLPLDLAYWRTFHHPVERRHWRCRPTPLGPQVQFRDEEESEWSGRLLRVAIPEGPADRAPVVTSLGSFRPADPNDGNELGVRLDAAATMAMGLVAEQLADGFIETTRSAGEQFWERCLETWRCESRNEALISKLTERLLAVPLSTRLAVGTAMTWLTAWHGTTVEVDEANRMVRVVRQPGPWWLEEPTEAMRSEAKVVVAALELEQEVLKLLPLRFHMPVAATAMANLAEGGDDELCFDVLFDLLVHGGLYYGLPQRELLPFSARLRPTAARVAQLLAFGNGAPHGSGAHTTNAQHHFQRGCQAFGVLAAWARDDAAAEALHHARHPASKDYFLTAAEVRPDARWVGTLTAQRNRLSPATDGPRVKRYDAAIDACTRGR
jgi:hypothetical protein